MDELVARGRADAERSVVLEMGGEESERMPVVLRPLRSPDDYRQCQALQRRTWGEEFTESVPIGLQMVTQKVGGVAAGAFDSDGRMIGMVFGLTGPRRGRLVHWSHMLAVAEEFRGRGLGRELKHYQRQIVMERGVALMLWTFDPLVARNAYLNIVRLGVRPVEYVRDLYGPDTSSELHRGLGTDRFVVEWRLDAPAAGAAADPKAWAAATVLNVGAEGEPLPSPVAVAGAPRVRVEIPYDVQALKSAEEGAGGRWRRSTRQALEWSLREGYSVCGFQRNAQAGRCWYLLERRAPA